MPAHEIADSESEDDGESPPLSPQPEAASQVHNAPSRDELSRGTSSTDTAAFQHIYQEQSLAVDERQRQSTNTGNVAGSKVQDPCDFQDNEQQGPRKRIKLVNNAGLTGDKISAALQRYDATPILPTQPGEASQDELSRGMMYTSSLPYDQSNTAPMLGQRLLDLDGSSSGTHANSSPRVFAPEALMMEEGLPELSARTPPRSALRGSRLAHDEDERPMSSLDVLAEEEGGGATFQIAPLGRQLLQEEDRGINDDVETVTQQDQTARQKRGEVPAPSMDSQAREEEIWNIVEEYQEQESDASDDYEKTHVKQKKAAAKKPRGRPKKAKAPVVNNDVVVIDDDDNVPIKASNGPIEDVRVDLPDDFGLPVYETIADKVKSRQRRGRPKKAKVVIESEDEEDNTPADEVLPIEVVGAGKESDETTAVSSDSLPATAPTSAPAPIREPSPEPELDPEVKVDVEVPPVVRPKKGRGRPKKNTAVLDEEVDELAEDKLPPAKTKKGRGRPKKVAQALKAVEEDVETPKEVIERNIAAELAPPVQEKSPSPKANTIETKSKEPEAEPAEVKEDASPVPTTPIPTKKEGTPDTKKSLSSVLKRPVPRVGFSKRDRVPSLLKIIKR